MCGWEALAAVKVVALWKEYWKQSPRGPELSDCPTTDYEVNGVLLLPQLFLNNLSKVSQF